MGKFALLIACGNYRNSEFPILRSPVKDVEKMKAVLEDSSRGEFSSVEISIDPDRQSISEQIDELFSGRKKDDLLLLYFSGHGIKDERGKLYLASCDAEKNDHGGLTKSRVVSATFVHDLMSGSRSGRQIIILDCCFSGAFAEGLLAKDDASVELESQLGGEGRVILTSSTALQYSFESKGLETSIYTQFLVEGMETGAADRDNDGWISIHELHEYAKQKVCEVEPNMKPEIYSVKEGFKILLSRVVGSTRKKLPQDWGTAPDLLSFFGRDRELEILKEQVLVGNCRLVTLVGM